MARDLFRLEGVGVREGREFGEVRITMGLKGEEEEEEDGRRVRPLWRKRRGRWGKKWRRVEGV